MNLFDILIPILLVKTLVLAVAAILFVIPLRFIRKPRFHLFAWGAVLYLGLFGAGIAVPISYQAPPAEMTPIAFVMPSQSEISSENPVAFGNSETIQTQRQTQQSVKSETMTPPISVWSALGIVWLGGVIVLFAFRLIQYSRLMQIVRTAEEVTGEFYSQWSAVLDGSVGPRLLFTESVGPALVHTLREAVILVPKPLWEEASDAVREGILRHELSHYRNRDLFLSFVYRIPLWIHWFNPLAWFAVQKTDEAIEWRCDAAAFGQMRNGAARFAESILTLHDSVPSIALYQRAFGGPDMVSRVRQLKYHLSGKTESPMKTYIFAVAMLLLFTAGLFSIRFIAIAEEEPDDDYYNIQGKLIATPEDIERYNNTHFTVPDGTPEEMLSYIRETFFPDGGLQVDQTKEGSQFFYRQCGVIKEAAEKGLAGNPTGETRKELLNYKTVGYRGPLPRKPELFPEFLEFVEELEKNPEDVEIATFARGRYLGEWNDYYFFVRRPTSQEFIAHRNAVLDFVKKEENDLCFLSFMLMNVAGKIKDHALALETAKLVRDVFDSSKNFALVQSPEGILHKHWLDKDVLRIVGVTFDDKKFDLTLFRGKTVVVIYWSPESGNIESLLPKLEAAYEKYHDRGLEIVSVCSDNIKDTDDTAKINEVLGKLPWSVNISEKKTIAASLPSNREYYDILDGNHFFLIDAEGKVKMDYFAITGYYSSVGDMVDGKFVPADELLERELAKMFP